MISTLVPKNLLLLTGTDDHCTLVRGCNGTVSDTTFDAISKTYSYWTSGIRPSLPIMNSPTISLNPHQSIYVEDPDSIYCY